MQSQTIERFLKELPVKQPLAYKAVYPRRIIPPNGYMNPKYFSITLWSELQIGFESEMKMLPHTTGVVNCLIHMKYKVPTYFVRSEFAQAVAQTEPPDDFKLSEINWPLPAMLFALPTEFALKYFGYMVPFISVTRSERAIYPSTLKDLPPCETPAESVNRIVSEVARFNVVYPVFSRHKEVPVDYCGSYPLTMNVNEMETAPYQDATFLEEDTIFSDSSFDVVDMRKDVDDLPNSEAERAFNNRVQSFAVKLMLALTARPNVLKSGGVQRPEKIRKNGVLKQEALWHPNLIGWDFKAKRALPEQPTEESAKDALMGLEPRTHASPRMHWRRGHMRNQPFGPKPWTEATAKRLLWIEPVLINAPD